MSHVRKTVRDCCTSKALFRNRQKGLENGRMRGGDRVKVPFAAEGYPNVDETGTRLPLLQQEYHVGIFHGMRYPHHPPADTHTHTTLAVQQSLPAVTYFLRTSLSSLSSFPAYLTKSPPTLLTLCGANLRYIASICARIPASATEA